MRWNSECIGIIIIIINKLKSDWLCLLRAEGLAILSCGRWQVSGTASFAVEAGLWRVAKLEAQSWEWC